MAKAKKVVTQDQHDDQAAPGTDGAVQTAGLRDRIKDFRRVPARQLEGAPWNWRAHPKQQQEAFAGSLEELGFYSPLEVRELGPDRYQIIDGHLRQEWINSQIGPDTLIPVIVTDFTEEEAKKANLTKDPLAAMATANVVALAALMQEVQIGSTAVADMLAQEVAQQAGVELGAATAPVGDPDLVPAPPDEAITRPGDLWLLGEHRLLCGDSSMPEDVDRLLGGAPVHLVNTDPHYNVRLEPRSNNAIAAGLSSFAGTTHHQGLDVARHPEKSQPTTRKLRAKDRPLANDFVSAAAFDQLLLAWFGNIARVLLPGRTAYIWGGYSNLGNYPAALKAVGLYFSQTRSSGTKNIRC